MIVWVCLGEKYAVVLNTMSETQLSSEVCVW